MINPKVTIEQLNQTSVGNMVSHIDIQYTEVGKDYLCGKMPVNEKTVQPLGLLHGGASVVLAETLGSLAANLCLDNSKEYAVGLEINANHIRSIKNGEGYVFGKAQAIHLGKKTHIWEIKITTEDDILVCISRLTMAVLQK